MKSLLILLVLLVIKGASAQNYHLQQVSQNPEFDRLQNIFVIDDKIWATFFLNSIRTNVYFNGSSWSILENQNNTSHLNFSGFKKPDGSPYVVFLDHWGAYSWNSQTNNFNHFHNPLDFTHFFFAYSENNIYICTRVNQNTDSSYIYHWNGANGFTRLYQLKDEWFSDIYVVSPESMFLTAVLRDGSLIINTTLYHFDGQELKELYRVVNSPSSDAINFLNISSVDNNRFFIRSRAGVVFLWDHSQGLMTKVYPRSSAQAATGFSTGFVVLDNNNVFTYGSEGIKHINVSSGESTRILRQGGLNLFQVLSSHHDKYGQRVLFTSSGSSIWELKPNNTSIPLDNLSQKISLYPNPANDLINIDFQVSGEKTLRIYNISGAQLEELSFFDYRAKIDVSGLPPGAYLIRIDSDDGFGAKRFIKK